MKYVTAFKTFITSALAQWTRYTALQKLGR